MVAMLFWDYDGAIDGFRSQANAVKRVMTDGKVKSDALDGSSQYRSQAAWIILVPFQVLSLSEVIANKGTLKEGICDL